MSKRPVKEDKNNEKERPAKKAYQKPGFRYERVFETMALACGKANPQSLQCSLNRKTS